MVVFVAVPQPEWLQVVHARAQRHEMRSMGILKRDQQPNLHSQVWTSDKGVKLGTSSSRVLVVEDSEHFRKFFRSTLRKRPELQIVGEVIDGLEAVERAEQVQPDLIVLDIGLPSLNGIEAARQIRKVSPKSKILFVSQESSTDV